jgi:hypothetical protein
MLAAAQHGTVQLTILTMATTMEEKDSMEVA